MLQGALLVRIESYVARTIGSMGRGRWGRWRRERRRREEERKAGVLSVSVPVHAFRRVILLSPFELSEA